MELMWIGSVNQYTKSLARQTQWNLKKQSGDFTGHRKSLGDYMNFTRASSVLPQTGETDTKMSSIMTKAQAGKKLSPDEWDYLRTKNPMLYEQLREAEREQKSYEEALRRCKTKDEALRLHVSKLGDILTAAKNGDSSALVRLNRLTQSMTAFTASKEYHELPTEAEQAIERESERKEKQEALREEAAVREAEREAGREAASRTEEEQDDTEAEAASEVGTEVETGAEARSGPETKDSARVPPRTETGEADASRMAVRTAPHSARPPERTDRSAPIRSAPTKDIASSVVSFGRRAYLDQREGEARSRRKRIDTEA